MEDFVGSTWKSYMVHRLMLLKWTVRKYDGSLWTGLTRVGVESSDRPF